MKIRDITDAIDNFAPAELAEEWDRIGLMLGALDIECTGTLITLDLTFEVANQAKEEGCNLIFTHHPFIFSPLENIDTDTSKGALIGFLIKNDITVYSAHTNLDKTEGGISCKLAQLFDGKNIVRQGAGALFEIPPVTLESFAKKVGLKLADKSVKAVGNPDKIISRVYTVGGSGGDAESYRTARLNADVLVTGDIKHHLYVEAAEDGFALVEFSHYGSEIIVTDIIYDYLKPRFADLKIIKAKQQCPFRILEEI